MLRISVEKETEVLNERIREVYITSISQYLLENLSATADDFISQSISMLNIQKRAEEQIKLIDQLGQ